MNKADLIARVEELLASETALCKRVDTLTAENNLLRGHLEKALRAVVQMLDTHARGR